MSIPSWFPYPDRILSVREKDESLVIELINGDKYTIHTEGKMTIVTNIMNNGLFRHFNFSTHKSTDEEIRHMLRW